MSNKEEFKNFIINKPELIDYVENGKTSWQKLYELYDLYGDKKEVWDKYKKISSNSIELGGIINTLKNIDLDSLEDNISRVQKVVGLVSEFTNKDDDENQKSYKEEKIEDLYGEKNEN